MGRHQTNVVHLTDDERNLLIEQTKHGSWSVRECLRAKILLLADMNGPHKMEDKDIVKSLGVSLSSVRYRRQRFASTQSLEDTIFDKPRSGRPTVVDGEVEANITMIACSDAPEGRARWTLNLIKDRLVELEVVEDIGESTVRRALKKMPSNLG